MSKAYVIVPKKVGTVAACETCVVALSADDSVIAANDAFHVYVPALPDGAHAHCQLCGACLTDDSQDEALALALSTDGQLPN